MNFADSLVDLFLSSWDIWSGETCMKVDNKIYFAPDMEFKSVDWDDHHSLVEHFKTRVYAYYIIPVQRMLDWLEEADNDPFVLLGTAFGSGVICCTTIDFLALAEFNIPRVGERYRDWLKKYIPELDNPDPDNGHSTIAHRFYEEFRNGLVHEGRIKNAGQFSLDPDSFYPPSQVFSFVDHAMVVHPFNLLTAVETGLHQFCNELHGDPAKLTYFAVNLEAVFQTDVEYSIRS
jgi:hypothetical protein